MICFEHMNDEIFDKKITLESEIDIMEISLNVNLYIESSGEKVISSIKKLLEKIKKIISGILEKLGKIFTDKQEKEIEKNLKDIPDIKFDYNPELEIKECEKTIDMSIKEMKSKNPRKISSGTKDKLIKSAKIGGVTILTATATYTLYKKIKYIMKKVNDQINEINFGITGDTLKRYDEILKQQNKRDDEFDLEAYRQAHDDTIVEYSHILEGNILRLGMNADKIARRIGMEMYRYKNDITGWHEKDPHIPNDKNKVYYKEK